MSSFDDAVMLKRKRVRKHRKGGVTCKSTIRAHAARIRKAKKIAGLDFSLTWKNTLWRYKNYLYIMLQGQYSSSTSAQLSQYIYREALLERKAMKREDPMCKVVICLVFRLCGRYVAVEGLRYHQKYLTKRNLKCPAGSGKSHWWLLDIPKEQRV